MKTLSVAAIALLTLTGAAYAADPAAPADKKDSGSLSAGQKEASPATKNQGENAPVGSSSGSSTGESGSNANPAASKDQPPKTNPQQ